MSVTHRVFGEWIPLLMRLFLGGFYVVAGAVKIPDPGRFAEAVANYRLLPHELINLAAIILPWVEVVAGLFLILGLWLRASAWLINAMTVLFIVAIGSAVARGLSIECGCFGTVGGREVGLKAIAEDVLLLAFGLWILWSRRNRPKSLEAPGVAMASPTQA
jgi:putative oxidoreductase